MTPLATAGVFLLLLSLENPVFRQGRGRGEAALLEEPGV